MPLDPLAIRQQFPLLQTTIDGKPLVYLDSAATTQKPQAVLDAMDDFYKHDNANAHRSMHVLAERATLALEGARKTVQRFLKAKRAEEILFTHGTTESINLVARSFGSTFKKGDAVVLTKLEHHSNIVPWLQLKQEKDIDIEWMDIEDDGSPKLDDLKKFLQKGNVKLVAMTGQSNVLGVRPPLKEISALAHDAGAKVLIDAAQLVAHSPIDVQELDCDFLAFSGHKLYGPLGIGVLYGKRALLEAMPPFLGGGMMIQNVTEDEFTPADIPQKFEAGTQPVAEAVGLGAAIDWLSQFSWNDIQSHEQSVIEAAVKSLSAIDGLTILGPATSNQQPATRLHGCLSFTTEGIHPHDLTDILGRQGVCLRAGHHCAQPLHKRLGINASSRISFGIYTTAEDVIALAQKLPRTIRHLLA